MIDLFDSIEETIQEEVTKEEAIQDNMQEDKQESQEEATADASEVAQSEDDDIDKKIEDQEEYEDLEIMLKHNYGLALPENITDENLEKIKSLVFEWHDFPFEEEKHQIESLIMDATDASEPKQEETIQENKQEDKEIEYSFKHYLKSIIPMQDFITQEDSDSISFIITIKKSDLSTFKQPKVYTSYEHSQKIKRGQEEAKKRGKKPGLKQGMKRERSDKKALIDQIKKLSKSFNGSMNNHELAKELNCSLNRICNYKREIKQQLKNSN